MKIKEEITWEGKFKGGNYIRTSILDKAPKGEYKNDIVRLKINSENLKHFVFIMTPFEALNIACALMNTYVLLGEKRRKLR